MSKIKKSLIGFIPKEHWDFKWKREFRHQSLITQVETSRKIIRIPLIMSKSYGNVNQRVRITIEVIKE